ncbi:MAG: alpha/beta hydrolase [Ilumatobacteraceae bacterium]|nr:alpha/beta hydrolase [Ilumatobacteraceae bacterium]
MTVRRLPISVLVLLCLAGAACTSTGKSAAPISKDGTPTSQPQTTDSTDTDNSLPATDDTSPVTSDTPTPDEPAVAWASCDDPMVTDDTLQCATVSVPLDYDNPAGDHIDLALVRVPATGDRVGAVLFNPGGPGASGFDYIAQAGTALVSAMGLQDFDLIGFDPRGVQRSNGLRCLTDAQLDATMYLDDTPNNPTEQAAVDASDQEFENACIAKYGDTLRYYSTDATARDMDSIRAALGDDQISYLGVSYGTYLGATYATLFPDRVRAMVLDSAYEPTGDTIEQQYTTDAVGFETAFDHWATWCETNETCTFHSADVGADWDALATQLDTAPVPAADGRAANQSVMQTATIASMYSENDWPKLADALAAARNGDGTKLFALADDYVGRSPDGTYSTIEQSYSIIQCASGIEPAQPDDPAALVAELHQVAPRFSRNTDVDDFTDSCAPLMPQVTPRTLQYDGDAPVVVIGGTNDPATPFRWATEMDALMGPDSALVTYTGEGHGVLLASQCGTAIEAALLVDLKSPADGTVCAPDPVVDKPAWWDDLPVPGGVSAVFDSPAAAQVLGLGPTLAYSELRTTSLSPSDALDAYDTALQAAGFQVGDRQAPTPGLLQGVYQQADGGLFSVIAIGPDSFGDADFKGLADLVPAGQTLLILLAPHS